MYIYQKSAIRRIMSGTLILMERLKAADSLLFIAVLLFKLYMFNRFLGLPNMKMTKPDALIEFGAVLLFSFWTLWLPARGRILALMLLNMLASFVLFADLVYYRYFQDLISVPVLLQLSQVDSLGGSIGTLLKWKDVIFFADWLVMLPFGIYALRYGRRDLRDANEFRRTAPAWQKASVRIVLSAAIFLIGSSLVFSNVNHAKRTWALGVFEANFWNLSIYNVTGELGFHGYDVYRYVKRNWLDAVAVSAEQSAEAKQWIEVKGDLRGALEQDELFGAYEGSNVLMLQLEAFHNFMIGKTVDGQEVTPNLNKLVKQSAYFSRFYHQTAQGRTSDADFTANCSMQPVPNGSVFIQYAPHEFNCMPSTLKDYGYGTSVFHAYEGGFWNRNTMYRNMRYDQFYSLKHFALDEKVGWALGDKSFFKQSLDVVSEQRQPFYSFMITLSSHHPYTMPASEQKLSLGELKGTMMGDYLQAAHYVDAALGELIERMKAEGLWDNTILAMYGDHDNSIKDWSQFETFFGKPLSELERQQIMKQVPFIVHLPKDAHAGIYEQAGGQLDVTPTIMHLLGISTADQYLIGMPLLTGQPLQGKQVVQRNGAFTDGDLYYMPSEDGVAGNGTCWSVADNAEIDMQACLPQAEEARLELKISDQIVMSDLIASFNEQNASEARANTEESGSSEAAALK